MVLVLLHMERGGYGEGHGFHAMLSLGQGTEIRQFWSRIEYNLPENGQVSLEQYSSPAVLE